MGFSFLVIALLAAAASPDYPPGCDLPAVRPAFQPADSGDWLNRAELPHALAHHMVASLDNPPFRYCFAIGGRRSIHSEMIPNCLRYSTTSNNWVECAPMCHPRGIGRAVTVRNLVYVLGGCEEFGIGLFDVEVYDPPADTWSVSASMPESLHDFGAVVWRDSLVYVIGGGNWSPLSPPADRVWLFNPGNGTWRVAASVPVPIGAFCCGLTGDTIVIATGWTASGMTNAAWLGVIDPANPAVITWERLDTLPGQPRCRANSAVFNGKLYLTGGLLDSGGVSEETWALDPHSGQWLQLGAKPNPAADVYGAGLVGSRLHFPAGYPGAAPYLRAHDVLNLGDHEHDVGVNSIASPVGRLAAGLAHQTTIEVANFGHNREEFAARIDIRDSITGERVFAASMVLSLDPDEFRPVEFGGFIPLPDRFFTVCATVSLAGDENPDNDSVRGSCRTTAGSEPDGFGYVYESTQEPDTVTFEWLAPTLGDTITDWEPDPDDGISLRILPFRFPFYGDTLEELYVCTNGFLQTSELTCPVNRGFPFLDLTDIIAPFWDDLTLRETGAVIELRHPDRVSYTWSGVPQYNQPKTDIGAKTTDKHRSGNVECRMPNVDFRFPNSTFGIHHSELCHPMAQSVSICGSISVPGAQHDPPAGETLTFQVVLYPSGTIRFNYLSLQGTRTSSTVGIQGRDGSGRWYQEYACNGEPDNHIPADSVTVLFRQAGIGIAEATLPGTRPALIELDLPGVATGPTVPIRLAWTGSKPSVAAYNSAGRLVSTLRVAGAGTARLSWNLRDNRDKQLAPGTYFLRAATAEANVIRKLVLTR